MPDYLEYLRDPNTEDPTGGAPPQMPPETPLPSDIPKSKEEWTKLAKEDPVKFTELTQTRMDAIYKQNKEFQEKLAALEENNKNLQLEVQKFQQPESQSEQQEQYDLGKYPQTEEAWNDLFLERPAFANDLRNEYLNEQKRYQEEYSTVRKSAVETLTTEHPEMYVYELDNDGRFKKDNTGKPILKKDPNTGGPIFNPESDKGQLWTQIFNEAENYAKRTNTPNPFVAYGNGPILMMAEMERRLRAKGASMVKGQNNTDTDESGLAPQGVPPPKAAPVKFDSDEEREHARRAIARGTFKSEEDWAQWKARKENEGYVEPNRRPDFSKR